MNALLEEIINVNVWLKLKGAPLYFQLLQWNNNYIWHVKILQYIFSGELRQNSICGMLLYSDENLVGCVSYLCHSILPQGSRRLLQSISYWYQIFKDIIATKFSTISFRVWHFCFQNHNVTYQSMAFSVSRLKCHSAT